MIFSDIIKKSKNQVFPKIGFHKQNILSKIEKCRTPELGGHLYVCDDCQSVHLLNNSCSNRNCPVCQGNKRKKWIDKQCDNLINAPYFHVVFTIPDVLNSLFLKHQKECYNALYHSVWNTLKSFFKNDISLSGKGGMLCILHTWGQNLAYHPHLHCLVPAAGISKDGEFKLVKGKDKFLFDVKNMSTVFRAKFAEELTFLEKQNIMKIPEITRKLMFSKSWVVFSQRPFSSPENVVRYIGMYSHRVAISENRIIENKDQNVNFFYKDYKNGGEKKVMQLKEDEFIRRFSMHILPFRFMKIRYFGLLNNRNIKYFTQTAKSVVGLYCETNDLQFSQTTNNAEVSGIHANDLQVLNSEDHTNELDYDLDDEKKVEKKTVINCPSCKTGKLRKLMSFNSFALESGVLVVNINTSEILYNSRDGPISDDFSIIEISL